MSNSSEYANFFPTIRKTRLPGGYMGKILRVDMTTGKLNGQVAFMSGKLRIAGDMGLALRMQSLFA